MTSLGARMGFWLALIAIGAAASSWLMWGQVQDAREVRDSLSAQLVAMGKQLQEVQAQQLRIDAILATHRSQAQRLTRDLGVLRSDLERTFDHDQKTRAWADDCVPAVVAKRMQLPADPRCPSVISPD